MLFKYLRLLSNFSIVKKKKKVSHHWCLSTAILHLTRPPQLMTASSAWFNQLERLVISPRETWMSEVRLRALQRPTKKRSKITWSLLILTMQCPQAVDRHKVIIVIILASLLPFLSFRLVSRFTPDSKNPISWPQTTNTIFNVYISEITGFIHVNKKSFNRNISYRLSEEKFFNCGTGNTS